MLNLVYEDVAPDAKSDSGQYVSTDKQAYVDMADLSKLSMNTFPNYALCLPKYSMIGTKQNAIATENWQNVGYVSYSLSDSNGEFTTNPIITRTLSKKYSSKGISLSFNTTTGDYCSEVNIKWYEDATLLYDVDFAPDSDIYFCEKEVENFNKIIIELKKTNNPYRYAWITAIDYGTIRNIGADEAKNVRVLAEISPISEELSINTMDVTLIPSGNVDYMFQKAQKMVLYHNRNLIGSFYIKEVKRINKSVFELSLQDNIGILAQKNYDGGMYNNESFANIVEDICTKCNVNYEIADDLSNETITGYMPIMSSRDALCWLCMSVGAVADTFRSDSIKIYKLSSAKQRTITKSQELNGLAVNKLNKATEVKIDVFDWNITNDNVYILRKVVGTNDNGDYIATTEEPLGSYSASGVTINTSNANKVNYTVNVNTTVMATIYGKKYDKNQYEKSKKNPNIVSGDVDNVIELRNIQIVNKDNAQAVLDRIYNHYLQDKEINAKIILGDNSLGDNVDIDCDYEGMLNGNIVSLQLTVTNSSIVGEAVIR